MPDKAQKLKEAVAAEAADLARREVEYRLLILQMDAYQNGTGPAPTPEQFAKWRDGVAAAVKIRSMQSGFGDLDNK